MTAIIDDDDTLVTPDGLSVRRRRHDLSLSQRDLVQAIADAQERATGLRDTVTPSQLQGIEERAERIPWAMLRIVASGLDCDPVDILAADPSDEEAPDEAAPKEEERVHEGSRRGVRA